MTRLILAGNNLAAIHVLDLMLEMTDRSDLLVLAPADSETSSWHPSLAEAAQKRSVRVIAPVDVNAPEAISEIAEFDANHLFSVYYTQIFKAPLLGALRSAPINFHPSLLPRHRGTAPLVWAIADGDSKTGLTVHLIDEGIDTGNVIFQHPIPIHPDDTGYSLHLKLASLCKATAAELLRLIDRGQALPDAHEQSGEPSYHSKRDPRLNHLRWTDGSERLRNIVRALAPPLPGAYALLAGQRMTLEQVSIAATSSPPRSPGMAQTRSVQAPVVWCGDGAVQIDRCILDGRNMTGEDLLQSGRLSDGDVLS